MMITEAIFSNVYHIPPPCECTVGGYRNLCSHGIDIATYTYDANGLRTSKTVDGVTYRYTYGNVGLLSIEKEDEDGNISYIDYLYNPDGSLLGFRFITWASSTLLVDNIYYFMTGHGGDVLAILDDDGRIVVEYEYDAWGNFTEYYPVTIPSYSYHWGALEMNVLRYRGYVYDEETNLYYLQSRYYSPETCRFINSDTYISTGTSTLGCNMFIYCDNNPVSFVDDSGYFLGTLFDIVSLCASIYDVIKNPDNPWAWLGLLGDIADLLLLGVSGIGEATKVARVSSGIIEAGDMVHDIDNACDLIDDVHDADNILDAIKLSAEKNLPRGTHYVYISKDSNELIEYVGITNDFGRRHDEWRRKGRIIIPYLDSLDRQSARIVEQTVIETFGMRKAGGILNNRINSVSSKNPLYGMVIAFKKTLE